MTIRVNGKETPVPSGATLAMLVERLGLAGAPCAAEVNRRFVPKRAHADCTLHEGDAVELVTLVGGG